MASRESRAWSELALRRLSEGGHRTGGARRAVVELLAGEDCCLTALEIAERLRSGGTRVGTASVYRALDLMHANGLVHRVELGDGSARYEAALPAGEHHHHVVCESCGRVAAFEDESLERAIGRLARRLGHNVRGHDVVIRGRCKACEH